MKISIANLKEMRRSAQAWISELAEEDNGTHLIADLVDELVEAADDDQDSVRVEFIP